MDVLSDIVINPNKNLIALFSSKKLAGSEVFVRKGENGEYIKYQSLEKFKVSNGERVLNLLAALVKTIFSLGLAPLFFEGTRENWSIAWYKQKSFNAYIVKTDVKTTEEKLTLKQIVMKGIPYNGRLQDIPESLRDDEEVVLGAIRYGNPTTLQDASARLRAKKEVVSAAVEKHGNSYQHIAKEFQDDKETVLKALKTFPIFDQIPSETLRKDPEVLEAAKLSDERFSANKQLLGKMLFNTI